MKVVVTGSLGHIGLPLTRALVQKGHTVTVISSKPEKQKDIAALGASAATGSVEDADFLRSAFKGADSVFVMIPPNYTKQDQVAYYRRIGGNYAEAIQQSGVRRVVHLSSYGSHLDKGTGFILGTYHTEGILNGLPDIHLTHLRPGYFYYNLYNFRDMIKAAGFIGANYGGEDKLVLVGPSDIAVAAAEELTSTTGTKKIRYVASDERTANEVARVLGMAIGKPQLTWQIFTDEQALNSMMQRGVPAHIAANLVELGASIHSGALMEDYELHKPAMMGDVKLEDFAKEFAAAF